MQTRRLLQLLFGFIFVSLLATTSWAGLHQPVWEWQGLTLEPDRWWTLATLVDAYYGFITFFVWVCCKERSMVARSSWFIVIMALGNMAMSVYVLIALSRLAPDEPIANVLLPRPRNAE